MLPKVGPGGGRGRRPHLPKLEALPPMETCAHTTQGSGPREQVFKHTPFPGFPLCQAPCLLRAGHRETPSSSSGLCQSCFQGQWPGAQGGQHSLHLPYLPEGATVLFLNATDLDRSREYGQESIIYSLEGSSQFRINARSGEPRQPLSSAPHADSPCPRPASRPGLLTASPSFEQASLEHLVLSLKY